MEWEISVYYVLQFHVNLQLSQNEKIQKKAHGMQKSLKSNIYIILIHVVLKTNL